MLTIGERVVQCAFLLPIPLRARKNEHGALALTSRGRNPGPTMPMGLEGPVLSIFGVGYCGDFQGWGRGEEDLVQCNPHSLNSG
jgi:hypothetical protein